MRSIELGIVLPMEESWTDGSTARWVQIRELATRAEAVLELLDADRPLRYAD